MILLGHKFPKTDLFQSQNNLHFNSINSEKRLPRKLSEALILLYLLSEGSSARNAHRTTFSLNSRLRTHSVFNNYSITVATRPDPTVRPPSRIANVRPCSIATGWMSSIVISTLSPGMHISVPAGSSQTPVTSVVLK